MDYSSFLNGSSPISTGGTILFILIVVWSLIWKGLALWRAARRNDNAWFVILLIFNTIGILEIIYYFLIAKPDKKA